MNDQSSSPPPRETGAAPHSSSQESQTPPTEARGPSLWQRLMRRFRGGQNGSVREALEEIIEERAEPAAPIGDDERALLSNILNLRGLTVEDVMVPRADIVGVEVDTPLSEIVRIIGEQGHSRLPVYRGTLDDVIGMAHIKDLFLWDGHDKDFKLSEHLRRILFVAPSMEVLELLLEMRARRSHMALVVDEYGGVDGLVTIEDLVEEIIGEIEDEHDRTSEPVLKENPDGSYTADARVEIEALEEKVGAFATDEEREYIDTLGGLVFALAGRVPIRSELVAHPSGFEFEILQADPRRVHRLRVRRRSAADKNAKAG
ncbi:hemolysin family protein [Thalassospiraceae bacterium LMO-SO8]|nr:hemolysin family protein [Alphaproteobacteria bacterium LMO-S08]WND77496.1 hemolysin family protein [Thalassospiraceae bacterium LMO-SO8]